MTATYSDDSSAAVTEYSVSGYDKDKVGEQTITVAYEGKTATFTVKVSEVKDDDGKEDPKTGDSFPLIALMLVMVFSSVLIIFLLKKIKVSK